MTRLLAPAVCCALALSACGGGGGPTPPADPPGAFLITPENAESAAAVAYRSAVYSADIAGTSRNSGIVAGAGGGVSAPGAAKPGALLPPVFAVPFGPETLPCAVSGFLTISGDLASQVTLSAGDYIVSEAAACNDGGGEVVDGAVRFDIDAFAGDLIAEFYSLTMTLTLTDFQVTTADDVVTGNGAATAALDLTNAPQASVTVSGTAVTVDSNGGSETLSDFQTTRTIDGGAPVAWTLAAEGNLDTTELEKVITYSTPVTFAGVGASFPSSGELLVVADDDSSARLIALDDANVRIEVDSNGDGTVDTVIDTTWSELTD